MRAAYGAKPRAIVSQHTNQPRNTAFGTVNQRWLVKFGQVDKWNTNWWLIVPADSACVLAKTFAAAKNTPAAASPALFEAKLRTEGDYKDTEIFRDPDGNLTAVSITGRAGAHDLTVFYFSGRERCEITRQGMIKAGALAKPNELR